MDNSTFPYSRARNKVPLKEWQSSSMKIPTNQGKRIHFFLLLLLLLLLSPQTSELWMIIETGANVRRLLEYRWKNRWIKLLYYIQTSMESVSLSVGRPFNQSSSQLFFSPQLVYNLAPATMTAAAAVDWILLLLLLEKPAKRTDACAKKKFARQSEKIYI